MKKFLWIAVVSIFVLGVGGIAIASGFGNPAEIYADLTGTTVDEAIAERGTDKTFGQLADEQGLLDEFRAANLESKKAILQQRVEEGVITQEQADEIIKQMEEGCTLEPGSNRFGQNYNLGFGRNNSMRGQGMGNGSRVRRGRGQGRGYRYNSNN